MPFRSMCAAVGVALGAAAAGAQQQASAAFAFITGTDTIGVERFTRTPASLEGSVVFRGQPRVGYTVGITGPGRAATIDLSAYAAGAAADAPPLQRAMLRAERDSVIIDIVAGGATRTQRIASKPDALLMINTSAAMFELALERLRATRGDSVAFPIFFATGGQTITASLRAVTPDSIIIRLGPQESHLIANGSRVLRIRTPAQGLLISRVEGPAAARLSLGKPDYSPPPGAPYRAEAVTVPVPAGHTLAGTLTLPANSGGRVAAAITITGSGSQDRDELIPLVPGYRIFRQVADTLGRRGIAVLRLDDRGYGESTGNAATATTGDFADDIRAAVAYLRSRPEIDPARIALVGHSEGGMIAPMVAATDPRLAAIVLLAGPAKRGKDVIDFQIRFGIEHDTSIAPAKRDSALRAAVAMFDSTSGRMPWMTFFVAYDPLPTAAKVKTPTLILQGATDQQVTAEQAEALAAAMRGGGNRDVTVRVYPDRNHLFLPDPNGNPAGYVRLTSGKVGPEVMGQIADWLELKLRAK